MVVDVRGGRVLAPRRELLAETHWREVDRWLAGDADHLLVVSSLPWLVPTAAGPVAFAATHLSFVPGPNLGQLRHLQDRLAAWAPPRLLAGDLNLWLPLVRVASRPGWRPLARGGTFPNRPHGMLGQTVQLDHVLASGAGLWPRRSRIHAGAASDHRALVVEVELGS